MQDSLNFKAQANHLGISLKMQFLTQVVCGGASGYPFTSSQRCCCWSSDHTWNNNDLENRNLDLEVPLEPALSDTFVVLNDFSHFGW